MRGFLGLLLVGVSLSGPLPAQSGQEYLDEGLKAYKALEMEDAARLLRLALEAPDLPEADRLPTYAYLGAAEFYGNRQDASRAAFRRLVLLDPRYRLDPVAFPPEVTAAFDVVRLATPALAVEVPERVTFQPGRGGLTARVYPSGPHVVRVRVEASSGEVLRTLHDARVADSLVIRWDGAGARGARLGSGLYVLSFTSIDDITQAQRILDVPVRLERSAVDARPLPPEPELLLEENPSGPALFRLGIGLGAAALSWIVTPAITDNDVPRVALTLAFTTAGVVGFFDKRPGKPLPDNIAANELAIAEWRAEVARIEAGNRQRRPGERIVLETGRPSVRR